MTEKTQHWRVQLDFVQEVEVLVRDHAARAKMTPGEWCQNAIRTLALDPAGASVAVLMAGQPTDVPNHGQSLLEMLRTASIPWKGSTLTLRETFERRSDKSVQHALGDAGAKWDGASLYLAIANRGKGGDPPAIAAMLQARGGYETMKQLKSELLQHTHRLVTDGGPRYMPGRPGATLRAVAIPAAVLWVPNANPVSAMGLAK